MPSLCSNSSKRRTRKKHSRRTSSVHLSPTMDRERASEQYSRSSSSQRIVCPPGRVLLPGCQYRLTSSLSEPKLVYRFKNRTYSQGGASHERQESSHHHRRGRRDRRCHRQALC